MAETADPEPVDFVLDASALAKLFMDEPESEAFRRWYAGEVHRGATFAAPSLLGYEIANLLARNLDAPAESRAAWLRERQEETMTGVALNEGAAERTFPFTENLTAYDASYVAVAAAVRGILVSYDMAMKREAHRGGIQVIAPGRDGPV